jgi:glycosyltransferase involved in cell wall biosynthesis
MGVIIRLSPWSSLWSMGNGGGTSAEFVGVQCLHAINPQILHFVEDGSPVDVGNIAIPVHLKRGFLQRNILSRLGIISRRRLFEIRAQKWRQYNQRFLVGILAELKKRNIDSVSLVYCSSYLLTECGRSLGFLFKCPVVAHFYGTFLAPCIGDENAFWQHVEEYLGWTTSVHLRICDNDGSKGLEVAKALKLPLDTFLFQHHGLDIESFDKPSDFDISPYFKDGMLHVMTASRLISWKRLDRLIRIIPKIIQEVTNVHFLILGEGPERKALENLAKEVGVSQWITFVGGVSREVVYKFMRSCEVFVSTNDVATSTGVEEAMYFGMCVLATDTGDTWELIKDHVTGRLMPHDDMAIFSKGLIEVLSHPEIRVSLGKAAKLFIESHEPTQAAIMSERINRLRSLINNMDENLCDSDRLEIA